MYTSDVLKVLKVPHIVVAAEGAETRKAAGCIIRAEDTGRFLLAKRSSKVDDPYQWGTWGGTAEHGERPEQTAEREFREETQYKGDVTLTRLGLTNRNNLMYITFLGTVPTEFSPEVNWENEDWAWFNTGEWPQPRHWGLAEMLPEVEKQYPPTPKKKRQADRDPADSTGLYHATHLANADEIFRANRFVLSSKGADASNIHSIQNPRAHWYYLSCSTSRYNPYAYTQGMGVVFSLNSEAVRNNYKVIPIDYWGREFRNHEAEQVPVGRSRNKDEHEVRIVSTKPEMVHLAVM